MPGFIEERILAIDPVTRLILYIPLEAHNERVLVEQGAENDQARLSLLSGWQDYFCQPVIELVPSLYRLHRLVVLHVIGDEQIWAVWPLFDAAYALLRRRKGYLRPVFRDSQRRSPFVLLAFERPQVGLQELVLLKLGAQVNEVPARIGLCRAQDDHVLLLGRPEDGPEDEARVHDG